MAERLKAAVLKTVEGDEPSVGSNPTLSAIGEVAELVEGGTLLMCCTALKPYRGFESHPLRHALRKGACCYLDGLEKLRRDAREAEGARLEIVCGV